MASCQNLGGSVEAARLHHGDCWLISRVAIRGARRGLDQTYSHRSPQRNHKESNSPLNALVQGLKEFGYVDGVDVDVVFRVYYKRVDESVGTYSMDHTGAIYLMDKTGQFTASLSFKTEDSVAIERLRSLATL